MTILSWHSIRFWSFFNAVLIAGLGVSAEAVAIAPPSLHGPESSLHVFLSEPSPGAEKQAKPSQGPAAAPLEEAERLFSLGVQQFQSQQYEAALESWQGAVELYRQGGDRQQEGRVLGNLGAIYQGLGDYERAIALFEQSLAVAQEIGDLRGQSYALDNLGYVHGNLGHYAAALEAHQLALELARQQGDRQDERHSLNNLGIVYKAQGRYEEAVVQFEQGLAIALELGDRAGEAQSLGNLGNAHAERGSYPDALAYYDRCLELMQALGDRRGEAIVLQRQGNVLLGLGNLTAAQEHYNRSLAIARELRDLSLEAYNLGNLGIVAREQGEMEQALRQLDATLALLRQTGDRPREAMMHAILGNTYLEQGNLEQAQAAYEQSLAIAQALGNPSTEAIALGNLGLVADVQGQADQALALYQRSLALAEDLGDQIRQGQALNNLGALYYDQFQDLEQAAEALTAAVEIWEALRPGLTDEQQISLFETQAHTYRLLQQVLIELNQPNKALEVAERGRARAFVELVATRLSATAATQFQTAPLTVAEIRAVARRQNATLVQYSVLSDTQVAIWVIQPDGDIDLRLTQLDAQPSIAEAAESTRVAAALGRSPRPLPEGLQQRVRGVQDLMRGSSPEAESSSEGDRPASSTPSRFTNTQLQALYQLLIQPIADLLPPDPDANVVIIPHESLFLVPFAALQNAEGQFLIEQHTLLSAPAIQVLALTQQRQQEDENPPAAARHSAYLVVGNPAMPSLGTPPQPLAPLPSAEIEAQTIAALLNTTAATGAIATESRITAQMPQARIIHLATHGLLDDVESLNIPGAIALAPGTGEDGLLTSGEILDLTLDADLVVLSACNTGRGRITGDGVVGLSRTFMSAGAASVVVSLWAVPDAPTSALMTAFYGNLSQGMTKSQALRQAMLSTLETHPSSRDWAAFTLMSAAD